MKAQGNGRGKSEVDTSENLGDVTKANAYQTSG
jgi:hypothetical protein